MKLNKTRAALKAVFADPVVGVINGVKERYNANLDIDTLHAKEALKLEREQKREAEAEAKRLAKAAELRAKADELEAEVVQAATAS